MGIGHGNIVAGGDRLRKALRQQLLGPIVLAAVTMCFAQGAEDVVRLGVGRSLLDHDVESAPIVVNRGGEVSPLAGQVTEAQAGSRTTRPGGPGLARMSPSLTLGAGPLLNVDCEFCFMVREPGRPLGRQNRVVLVDQFDQVRACRPTALAACLAAPETRTV